MPHPLLIALFPDRASAEVAARDAHQLGVPREDLSVVASTREIEGTIADKVDASPGAELEDSRPAGRVGEVVGSILGVLAVSIPGTGALVAAGPLSAELGEAAGHAAGHLPSILAAAGLSEEDAREWQRRIDAGAVLIGVHARRASAAQIEALLARHGIARIVATEWED